MDTCDYYDFEKSKAKSAKVGDIINGFEVTYVDAESGIILVDVECKGEECDQGLRLFEALSYGDLCESCTEDRRTI